MLLLDQQLCAHYYMAKLRGQGLRVSVLGISISSIEGMFIAVAVHAGDPWGDCLIPDARGIRATGVMVVGGRPGCLLNPTPSCGLCLPGFRKTD